ncbi:hypothetical protein CSA17_06140 [bacterium DOLJORAL78_65_58]|nr:MAG: hypothetical protein CSA17_06140 [bacterium DOLJORAL78_65_58]
MLRHLLAGESHGPALVGILEGFPAGLRIKKSLVDGELALRQQGYGRGPRVQSIEKDQVTFLSGFWQGRTLGSPIAFQIPNLDYQLRRKRGIKAQRWQVPRPGHADLPGVTRYGYDDCAPVAERASARSTAALVAAGACAKALLREFGITVLSHTRSVGGIEALETEPTLARLRRIRRLGLGLEVAGEDGQNAHDEIFPAADALEESLSGPRFRRTTNRAGGLEGGITNGEPVVVRGFVKPISSQRQRLRSVNLKSGRADLAAWVRSDTCVVPAAGIVGEAVVAWRLGDALTSFLGGADLKTMLRRFRDLENQTHEGTDS